MAAKDGFLTAGWKSPFARSRPSSFVSEREGFAPFVPGTAPAQVVKTPPSPRPMFHAVPDFTLDGPTGSPATKRRQSVMRRRRGSMSSQSAHSFRSDAPSDENKESRKRRQEQKRQLEIVSDDERAKIQQLFDKYDEDGDGSISVQELMKLLDEIGHPMAEEKALDLLHQVDTNENGQLEMDEFMGIVKIFKNVAQFRMHEGQGASLGDQLNRTKEDDAIVLEPSSKVFWVWHLFMMIACTYAWASVIALHLFDTLQENYDTWKDALLAPDILLTIAIFANAAVEVNTGLSDAASETIRDRRQIVNNYVKRWLAVDLIALLPLRAFAGDPLTAIVLGHFRVVYCLRMPYFLETPRGGSINSMFIHFHFITVPFVRNVLYFLCMVHFFAVIAHRAMPNANTYSESVFLVMYMFAGTGYGSVKPQSDAERGFLVGLCILAMLINGIVIGSIVSFLATSDVEAMRRNKLVETLAVLRFFDVPESLQLEVLQFQDHVMKKDIQTAFGHIIDHLPDEMKIGLTLQFRISLIQCVDLFAKAHYSTQIALAQVLEPCVTTPEEYIVLADEPGDTMFFINYGFIDILTRQGVYLETLSVNRSFGAEAIFEPFQTTFAASVNTPHLAGPGTPVSPGTQYLNAVKRAEGKYGWSAKTLTYVEVMALRMSAFVELLADFPRFRLQVETAVATGEGIPRYKEPDSPPQDPEAIMLQPSVALTVANVEAHATTNTGTASPASSASSESAKELQMELPAHVSSQMQRHAARVHMRELEDELMKETAELTKLLSHFQRLSAMAAAVPT